MFIIHYILFSSWIVSNDARFPATPKELTKINDFSLLIGDIKRETEGIREGETVIRCDIPVHLPLICKEEHCWEDGACYAAGDGKQISYTEVQHSGVALSFRSIEQYSSHCTDCKETQIKSPVLQSARKCLPILRKWKELFANRNRMSGERICLILAENNPQTYAELIHECSHKISTIVRTQFSANLDSCLSRKDVVFFGPLVGIGLLVILFVYNCVKKRKKSSQGSKRKQSKSKKVNRSDFNDPYLDSSDVESFSSLSSSSDEDRTHHITDLPCEISPNLLHNRNDCVIPDQTESSDEEKEKKKSVLNYFKEKSKDESFCLGLFDQDVQQLQRSLEIPHIQLKPKSSSPEQLVKVIKCGFKNKIIKANHVVDYFSNKDMKTISEELQNRFRNKNI